MKEEVEQIGEDLRAVLEALKMQQFNPILASKELRVLSVGDAMAVSDAALEAAGIPAPFVQRYALLLLLLLLRREVRTK